MRSFAQKPKATQTASAKSAYSIAGKSGKVVSARLGIKPFG